MDTPLLPLPPPSERRKLRDLMGISRKQAAAQIGVSARTYLRWEWGDSEPTPDHHRAYYKQLAHWRKAVEKYL